MEEDFKSELEWAEERLGDLVAFSSGEKFKELSLEDQNLIVQQAGYLSAYRDILATRASKAEK